MGIFAIRVVYYPHMVNPFDRNFFKFLLGFLVILAASWSVIYFVGRYAANAPAQATLGPR